MKAPRRQAVQPPARHDPVADEAPLLQRYMPSLDVLRGLAILMVVLDHALYWQGAVQRTHGIGQLFAKASAGGWLGVNLFFVLSGFLITGILLDSRSNPDYFSRFYLRRVLRILPAYLLTIVVLLKIHQMPTGFLFASLTFLTNYPDLFRLGQAATYGVFWTLAVEEQFYLLWPATVRALRPQALGSLCVLLLLGDPLLRLFTAMGKLPLGNVHSNTLLIADNLACGALAALFVRSPRCDVRKGRVVGGAVLGAGLLMELIGLPFGIAHRASLVGAALQNTPWDLIFTGSLLLLLSLPNRLFSTSWSAPLRFLGYISYGLYLYHLLVFEMYDNLVAIRTSGTLQATLQGSYVRLFIAAGLAILVAWLSRRFFEDRFLAMRIGRRQRKLLHGAP